MLDEDLDAIAAERLPAHVLDRGREEREEAARRRREAKETEQWYASQLAELEGMSAEQRQALLAEAGERFGTYDPRHWRLEQQIERLQTSDADGEGEGGDEPL